MKNQKTQLIIMLALLMVFVVGYFGLKAYNQKAAAKESEPSYTALNIADDVDITELIVTNSNGEFELKKDGDDWKLTSDDSVDIDESTLSTKLNTLKVITSNQVIENAENLADYGLDAPSLTISFTLSDGTSHTAKVGDYNSSANKYYLTVDDSDVICTVDSSIHANFEFTQAQITAAAEDNAGDASVEDATAGTDRQDSSDDAVEEAASGTDSQDSSDDAVEEAASGTNSQDSSDDSSGEEDTSDSKN